LDATQNFIAGALGTVVEIPDLTTSR
jgi:hypothetical protein